MRVFTSPGENNPGAGDVRRRPHCACALDVNVKMCGCAFEALLLVELTRRAFVASGAGAAVARSRAFASLRSAEPRVREWVRAGAGCDERSRGRARRPAEACPAGCRLMARPRGAGRQSVAGPRGAGRACARYGAPRRPVRRRPRRPPRVDGPARPGGHEAHHVLAQRHRCVPFRAKSHSEAPPALCVVVSRNRFRSLWTRLRHKACDLGRRYRNYFTTYWYLLFLL